MKTSHPFLVLAGVCSGLLLMAAEPPPGAPAVSTKATLAAAPLPAEAGAPSTNAAPAVAPGDAAAPAGGATNSEPPITVQDGAGGLLFNFHGAPLSLVLDYMSDAAGFIINNQADSLRGSVEVWSKKPITKDEAVELLDSVLRKNHYAVNRDGRILTIFSLDKAKTSSELPVHTVAKFEDVDPTDDMATWIVPVRYISATQLKMNLQILLPLETELSVNESANSLVMVAPGRDVRRALKIVNALDTSLSGAEIKVFRLHYADAKQLATEIMTLFSSNTQGGMGGMGRAMMFMNMMRGGGGGGGGAGGAGSSPAGTKVAATSDDYSNSLVVNAAPEVMKTIEDMILQVDVPTTDITEVKIFQLKYADPNQMADQLAQLFPDTSRTDNNNNFGFRFGGGPFGGGRFGGNQATSNARDKKKSQVLAVPEPRTRSIMVSAASELMPHIAEMVAKLDVDARHEVVKVFELANADPQDVQQILQDLFQRSGSIRANNSNNRQSMLGSGNPLTQRQMQSQQNNSSTMSGLGGGGSRTGGGGGGGGGMGF